jgi:hypothetical protein
MKAIPRMLPPSRVLLGSVLGVVITTGLIVCVQAFRGSPSTFAVSESTTVSVPGPAHARMLPLANGTGSGESATLPIDPSQADYIMVNASRGLPPESLRSLQRFFADVNLSHTVVHQGTLDVSAVNREGLAVSTIPLGSGIPMSALAIKPEEISATMGENVSIVTNRGEIVFGKSSAEINGIKVGDVVHLLGWNSNDGDLTVGAVEQDARIGGVEMVMSVGAAANLGFNRPFSMRAWGAPSRESMVDSAKSLMAMWTGPTIRIRYSWIPASLDDTIPQVRMKQLLGQFSIRRNDAGGIAVDPVWKMAHIDRVDLPLVGVITCNRAVAAAATAALQDLVEQGLGALVDGADSRSSGGCFSARVTRSLTGTAGHNLSRHTWGAAIDINPSKNHFGGPSHMDQRVIDAFGRHGFIWGGTFIVPDPMHFEYVG